MFRGYPEIICRHLQSWERHGLKRYYYNNWTHYLSSEQIEEYRHKYSIDIYDENVGIKIFFDESGELHIDNCHDKDLKLFLEDKMKGWYWWAQKEYEVYHSGDVKIIDLIKPYIKELKPGYYQVRYDEYHFNFDQSYMDRLKVIEYIPVNHNNGGYFINTDYPKLNLILSAIMKDSKNYSDFFNLGCLLGN